jgi:hypothetical protein
MQTDTKGKLLLILAFISMILTILSSSLRIQVFSIFDFDINLKILWYIFHILTFGLIFIYIFKRRLRVIYKTVILIGVWITIFIMTTISSYYLIATFSRIFYNNHKDKFAEIIQSSNESQVCFINYSKSIKDFILLSCDSTNIESPNIQGLAERLGFLEYKKGISHAFLFDDTNFITGYFISDDSDLNDSEGRDRDEYGSRGQWIKINENVYFFTY